MECDDINIDYTLHPKDLKTIKEAHIATWITGAKEINNSLISLRKKTNDVETYQGENRKKTDEIYSDIQCKVIQTLRYEYQTVFSIPVDNLVESFIIIDGIPQYADKCTRPPHLTVVTRNTIDKKSKEYILDKIVHNHRDNKDFAYIISFISIYPYVKRIEFPTKPIVESDSAKEVIGAFACTLISLVLQSKMVVCLGSVPKTIMRACLKPKSYRMGNILCFNNIHLNKISEIDDILSDKKHFNAKTEASNFIEVTDQGTIVVYAIHPYTFTANATHRETSNSSDDYNGRSYRWSRNDDLSLGALDSIEDDIVERGTTYRKDDETSKKFKASETNALYIRFVYLATFYALVRPPISVNYIVGRVTNRDVVNSSHMTANITKATNNTKTKTKTTISKNSSVLSEILGNITDSRNSRSQTHTMRNVGATINMSATTMTGSSTKKSKTTTQQSRKKKLSTINNNNTIVNYFKKV